MLGWLERVPHAPWPQLGPSNGVGIGSEKWVTNWFAAAVEHRNAGELTKLPICYKMPVQILCRLCIYGKKEFSK